MDYKNKYFKYKNKYIKKLHGGAVKTANKTNKPAYNMVRIYGAIYGACVGDAIGLRYEFLEKFEAVDQVTKDLLTNKGITSLPLLGGGPFSAKPGQISDDSEMALCLLRSLSEYGYYNQADVAQKYIHWYNSEPIDIGKTIGRALFMRKPSKNNIDMTTNAREFNSSSLSNGVLMRICPLGIFALKISNQDLKKFVEEESDLTHPNPIIKEAAYILCLAIKYAIQGANKTEIYDRILKKTTMARVKIILRDALYGPEPTYAIDESGEIYINTDDRKYQGYFGIALQNTIYELIYGTDYDSSMVNIIQRGGDTDTNCAIAGGLLGAYYGQQGINSDWLNIIKTVQVDRYTKYPYYSPNIIEKYIKKIFD